MIPAPGIPLAIAVDHPAFAGHFPGFPVVPGAVLLDEAMFVLHAATGIACNGVAWVKFLRPVHPGHALLVRHEVDANGGIRFEITCGAHKVVTGSLFQAASA